MKIRHLLILCLLLIIGLGARSSDYFLLPNTFFFHKGETLSLRLLIGDYFGNVKGVKYQAASADKFVLHEGSKNVTNLLSLEGNYLLRLVNVEATKAKDVDYEKWGAAYTFAFANSRKLPNNYCENNRNY